MPYLLLRSKSAFPHETTLTIHNTTETTNAVRVAKISVDKTVQSVMPGAGRFLPKWPVAAVNIKKMNMNGSLTNADLIPLTGNRPQQHTRLTFPPKRLEVVITRVYHDGPDAVPREDMCSTEGRV